LFSSIGSGKLNKVTNALSQRIMLLNTMSIEVVSMECMKELYEDDTYFVEAWRACKVHWSIDRTPYMDFHIQARFMFKN
jgi:hypothetical protein